MVALFAYLAGRAWTTDNADDVDERRPRSAPSASSAVKTFAMAGLETKASIRNLVRFPVFVRMPPTMSTGPDPDAVLMLRVKQGDRHAFEELVEKYKQPVMNLVYRTLPDATEAEDLAQHVFLQVFKSAHRYEVSAKFTTWLFTIARNLCLNEIRRRSRHPAKSLDETFPDHEPVRQVEDVKTFSPPESLLQSELEEKIEAALGELPEKQRTAILMCRGDEFSYDDIARVLGCSVSATKSLIHRGRETLKQKLKPSYVFCILSELKPYLGTYTEYPKCVDTFRIYHTRQIMMHRLTTLDVTTPQK